jgi:hypothetical protein
MAVSLTYFMINEASADVRDVQKRQFEHNL